MKRDRNDLVETIILGILGSLVVLTLTAPQLLQVRRSPPLLSLSILLRDTDSSGWTVARQGMEQAADELGAELRFLTLTAQNDSEEQTAVLFREIDGGADALVVVPAGPDELTLALSQRPDHCPVVTLESTVEGAAGIVASADEEVGRRLAQALLEDWTGGPVLLLDPLPQTGIGARAEGARAALEERGVPVRRAAALPQDGPEERWVMAFEPLATQQAAERKEAEELGFALYGVGSGTAITAQLERGNISALAAWSDYAAGYLAVRQAVEAAMRADRQDPGPLAFSIVRGEDIYAPENQKLLFPIMSSSGR